ncbi:hypothetical protein AFLA70_129g002580 [Aspergillus flavus AF70]|nr:hypothetical protein AFLA70_129g002580 [Aspergillus flavus AF70]
MSERDQPKPTAQPVKNALDKARAYWHDLADNASSLDRSISPEEMLFRVPALPARPIKISTVSFGSSSPKAVLSAASSISRVTEGSKRSVGEKVKETPWAYILSARLVEMQQQKGSEILYTDAQAPDICRTLGDELPTDFNVNIGKVDSGAARWWAALLAPGQGWKVIFTQQENTSYAVPWSVVLHGKQCIGIVWEDIGITVDGDQCDDPPTSQAALSILTKFCLMHNLGDQFYAAFAASLMFPTHNHHKITIELPFPTIDAPKSQITLSDTSAEEYMAIDNKIPFYISLGCNHIVVVSSLCGSFWESDIPCNLVATAPSLVVL